jgi:hypothetical protein
MVGTYGALLFVLRCFLLTDDAYGMELQEQFAPAGPTVNSIGNGSVMVGTYGALLFVLRCFLLTDDAYGMGLYEHLAPAGPTVNSIGNGSDSSPR